MRLEHETIHSLTASARELHDKAVDMWREIKITVELFAPAHYDVLEEGRGAPPVEPGAQDNVEYVQKHVRAQLDMVREIRKRMS
jgi:hypothetical protein